MPRTAASARRAPAIATVRSAASVAAAGSSATGSPGPPEQLDEERRTLPFRCREPRPKVCQALADEALRGVDQEDRGLEPPKSVDQGRLLPGVLEVMPGIGLVGDRVDERRCPDRQVGVDVDARAAAAVEPVVAGPRLVADQRDPQVLAVGQPEGRLRPRTEPGDEPVDDRRQPVDPDLEPGVPGASRRSVSGASPGSSASSAAAASSNSVSGRRGGAEGEAAGHVVEVRQRIAGQRRGLRLQGDELGVQPRPPVRLGDLRGQTLAEGGRVVAQAGRGPELLHVDLGLELGRAEVAVDEARDPLVEPEGEQEVVAGDRVGADRPAPGPSASRPSPADATRDRDVRPAGHRRSAGTRQASGSGIARAEPAGLASANGMCCRSTASRLMRSAAVFCSATSRT